MQNRTNRVIGSQGESIAQNKLKNLGYTFVDKNFYTRYGEIDLIMRKDKDIYFFEVKYRKNSEFGFGEEAISKYKIEKLRKSIEIWVTKHQHIAFENLYLNAISIDNTQITIFEIL